MGRKSGAKSFTPPAKAVIMKAESNLIFLERGESYGDDKQAIPGFGQAYFGAA
jgi:hypothetical protein|nr:hypothetical protein [uncultured Acetatifactor sp.]